MRQWLDKLLRKTSLRTRVLITVAGLLVIAIWGLAVEVTKVLQDDLQGVLSAQLSSTVRYVASQIDDSVKLHASALQDLAKSLPGDITSDPKRAQRFIEQRGISTGLFPMGVFVANAKGIVIADSSPLKPGRRNSSVADEEYFREAMASATPIVSRPLLAHSDQQPTVTFSVQTHNAKGENSGVMVGSVSLSDEHMFGEISKLKLGKTGYVIVLSPIENLIVSAADQTQILKPANQEPVVPLNGLLMARSGITLNSLGVQVLTASSMVLNADWKVLAAIPTEEAFAPITTIRRHVYLAALLITITVAGILGYLLNRQLAPLAEAGQAMKRMADGEEEFAALPIKRHDEIGRLIRHFNQLVIWRKRAEEELIRHRDHLQELVNERTADLSRAKEAAEVANSAKTIFLANVSHELRTPLQVILSFSALGQKLIDKANLEELKRYFSNIQTSGRDLLHLINDLLDLSKLEAGKMVLNKTDEDVCAIAQEIGAELAPLLSEKALALNVLAQHASAHASVDRTRIAQVFRNLISNAIKFSPPGGHISIAVETAVVPAGRPGIGPVTPVDGLRLTVRDEGIGIPEEELEVVFDKFVQSSKSGASGGTGLGLAICKEIVEAHGGRIRAANNAGGGAVLEVLLPLTTPGEAASGAAIMLGT